MGQLLEIVQRRVPTTPRDIRTAALKLFATAVVGFVAFLVIYPFLWMISASFKRPADVLEFPVQWIPDYWYPQNYLRIMTISPGVPTLYMNSIIVTVTNVTGALLFSALAAYAFAKLKFFGRDVIFLTIIATLMVPPQSTYVARFIVFTELGLVNTRWALILPGLFAAFGTFLLRQYFMQIPNEIVESGLVDGAGPLQIWARLVMPIARPAIATFVIVVFTHHWNDYETPLIFLRDPQLFTLPLGLVNFADETGIFYHYQMALSAASVLPVFIVFVFAQKQFIQGLASGAVKG